MASIDNRWLEHQRKQFIRPDVARFTRPDAHRWMKLDAARGYVPVNPKFYEALYGRHGDLPERRSANEHDSAERKYAARSALVDRLMASMRLKLIALRIEGLRRKAYNPAQPRDDIGRWTDGDGSAVRLASNEKPKLGRGAVAVLLVQTAKRMIEAFRSEKGLYDLFGHEQGTVGWTNKDGVDTFGSSSTLPSYTAEDQRAAEEMRQTLVEKYPEVMKSDNIGERPNNALFHAETTVLLRAAKENGGTLANQRFEVVIDRPMCSSCDTVLPLVGKELGNPVVTFVGPKGTTKTMHNGTWDR